MIAIKKSFVCVDCSRSFRAPDDTANAMLPMCRECELIREEVMTDEGDRAVALCRANAEEWRARARRCAR